MAMINEAIGVGFGTAALGGACFETVHIALENGFRKFDTAEAEYWYDQAAVGRALQSYFSNILHNNNNDDDNDNDYDHDNYQHQPQDCDVYGDANSCITPTICEKQGLKISTKIPPWELTSISNIRQRARDSRVELLGWCHEGSGDEDVPGGGDDVFPMDVYYIHAPVCWNGWHPRCDGVHNTLPLRQSWLGMEAAVKDGSTKRIGLSNVRPDELLDIIRFVKERQGQQQHGSHSGNNNAVGSQEFISPRMPDVLQAYSDPLHPAEELRRICQEHGIEFVSYSTLGTQHTMRTRGQNPVLGNPEVIQLSETYGRSTAEVVLSWALQRGMSVIPRSSKRHHIEQLANLLTQDPFLQEGDLYVIDRLALN